MMLTSFKNMATVAMVCLPLGLSAADHKEAPLIREDGTADINDVYMFKNPTDENRLVLAMTVNPLTAPHQANNTVFSSTVRYVFNISTDADTDPEHVLRVTFSGRSLVQPYTVTLDDTVVVTGNSTAPTLAATPNVPVIATGANGISAFAGPTDDPFFFDLAGFNRFLGGGTFTGQDGFAGTNVSTIALDVPLTLINDGATQLQFWGVTERRRYTVRKVADGGFEVVRGEWQQIERMGVPGVATVFIPTARKDEYNYATPADDAAGVFASDIVAILTSLGTNSTNIGILASVAIPDTLKLDTTMPATAGFPNGRRPQDDVIDTILTLVLNGPANDTVPANDKPFRSSFPFFAEPHQP